MPLGTELEIIHGWADDVIPAAHSMEYAQRMLPSCNVRLHLLPDDHRLGASLDEIATLFSRFLNQRTTSKLGA